MALRGLFKFAKHLDEATPQEKQAAKERWQSLGQNDAERVAVVAVSVGRRILATILVLIGLLIGGAYLLDYLGQKKAVADKEWQRQTEDSSCVKSKNWPKDECAQWRPGGPWYNPDVPH